jgi:hypothetical protein
MLKFRTVGGQFAMLPGSIARLVRRIGFLGLWSGGVPVMAAAGVSAPIYNQRLCQRFRWTGVSATGELNAFGDG